MERMVQMMENQQRLLAALLQPSERTIPLTFSTPVRRSPSLPLTPALQDLSTHRRPVVSRAESLVTTPTPLSDGAAGTETLEPVAHLQPVAPLEPVAPVQPAAPPAENSSRAAAAAPSPPTGVAPATVAAATDAVGKRALEFMNMLDPCEFPENHVSRSGVSIEWFRCVLVCQHRFNFVPNPCFGPY